MNTILFLQKGNGIFQQKLGQLKKTLASTLRERQQEQANRLNSSNYSGRFVGLINEEFFGKPMSEDEKNNITIKNSSKNSLKDSKNYYGSQEYANRLRSAGVNMSNASRLLNKLNTVNTYSIGENTARRLNKIGNGKDLSSTFRAMTMYKPVVVDGKRYDPGVYYNRGLMHNGLGEGVYGTFVHEYSHWADKALTPDATAYNHSLIKLNPNLNEKEKQYYGNDSEIRARAMDILMNYNHNKSKYKNLNDFLRKEGSMKGVIELRKTFKDENSFQNYMNHFVLNDNSGMNQDGIYYSKKGNKIHIKKANRGKFTDYCGGKVTNECILRGKNSSDPAVRKRATFAANARKWNHKKGGIIVAEGGIKLGNIFSLGKNVVSGITSLYSGIKQSNNLRKQEEQLLKDYNYISKQINTLDVINKTNQLFQELQLQDPNIHVSEIDWRNLYGKNEGIAKQLAQANARNYLINARQLMMLLNSQPSGGGFDLSGLLNTGMLLLSGIKSKTNTTGTTNTTTTNTQIPSTATPTYFSSSFDWSKPTLTSAIKFST